MPASFSPYASKSNKIRCWDDSNWNLQLLITLVGLWTNTYLPSWTPPQGGKRSLTLPLETRIHQTAVRRAGERNTRRMEPSVHMRTHFAFPSFAGWCKKRCTTVGAAALANWPKYPCHLHSPNRTTRMGTFALLEGSDKDGFFKVSIFKWKWKKNALLDVLCLWAPFEKRRKKKGRESCCEGQWVKELPRGTE